MPHFTCQEYAKDGTKTLVASGRPLTQVNVRLAKYPVRHRTNRAVQILKARKAFVTAPSVGKNKHFHVLMFEVAANLRVGVFWGRFFINKKINREKLLK